MYDIKCVTVTPIYACLLQYDKENRSKVVTFVWRKGQHKFKTIKISRKFQHNRAELITHHLYEIHRRH